MGEAGMTTIEWARNADGTAGETWNPTTGCDKISKGCDNCYALRMAGRLKLMGQVKYQRNGDPRTSGPGFGLTVHPDALDIPLRRRKPTTWFVNSMSDLFHKDVPDEFIARVWSVMARCPQHTFQILTKRPQRMHDYFGDDVSAGPLLKHLLDEEAVQEPCHDHWSLPNVWLGTTIESDSYTFRADHLRATPAAIRFLSLEPLLGPLPSLDLTGIDWVIAGAESGPGARPMNMDWVRNLRDRSGAAGSAFFLKQDATPAGRKVKLPALDGEKWVQMPSRRLATA
jgi:protein gp37